MLWSIVSCDGTSRLRHQARQYHHSGQARPYMLGFAPGVTKKAVTDPPRTDRQARMDAAVDMTCARSTLHVVRMSLGTFPGLRASRA
jgi:hypothetical protein